MELGNVAYKPGIGRMASGTIITYGVLVNIQVAGSAFGFCFRKLQGCVALSAVDDLVCALQCKAGGVVIKRNGVLLYIPAVGSVAGITSYFEIFTMRRLRHHDRRDKHQKPTYIPLNVSHFLSVP